MQPRRADSPDALTAVGPDDPPQTLLAVEEAESMLDGRIASGKLAGKTMWAAIWTLAVPVLLQQLVTACVGLVDKVIAGSLPGSTVLPALDGIGIGSYVGWFIGIAMAGLGVGAQAIIARGMGSGSTRDSESACGQAITLSLAWGALVGVLLWFAVVPLARVAGLQGDAELYCIQYCRILAVAMPLTGLMTVGSMCLHGAGDTWTPAAIAVAVNIVNASLSWVLSGAQYETPLFTLPNVLGIDGARWGVIGIAAGTALSYLVGAALTLLALKRGARDFHPRSSDLRPTAAMTWRIARIGIPNFAEGIALWAVNLAVMVFIGMIAAKRAAQGEPSDGLIGAHMIAVQWESFSFLPGFAMGIAAGALAGQYLGAGNKTQARKAIAACTLVGCVIMGVLGIVFMTCGESLTRIISREEVHLREVPPPVAGMRHHSGVLCHGHGDSKWTSRRWRYGGVLLDHDHQLLRGSHAVGLCAWALDGLGLDGDLDRAVRGTLPARTALPRALPIVEVGADHRVTTDAGLGYGPANNQ